MSNQYAKLDPTRSIILLCQLILLLALILSWYALIRAGLITRFFFGDPISVFVVIYEWFVSGTIYVHLLVTLTETLFAFFIGAGLGLIFGLWLGLSPWPAAILDPFIKALNAMPRVILAPIFFIWFGLGIWSKVALGVTLVGCIVFFNVLQGVREVNSTIIANNQVLGASRAQLLRTVYLPSAMSWVFSSLHTSIGMAFVAAVVGEYLGSARGVGYLILQAEGVFDVDTVIAGIIVLTVFALILDYCITALERRLLIWQPNR
jgi:NitT/TauT family transport system permease protein